MPNYNKQKEQQQQTDDPEQHLIKQDGWKCGKFLILVWFFTTAFGLFLVNTAPAGLVLSSWISGSVNVFNVTYLFNVPNFTTNKIPPIVLRELPTKEDSALSVSDSTTEDNLNEFEPFAKLVIFFLSGSSALSYTLFIIGLGYTYKFWKACFQKPTPAESNPPLDPFQYDNKITSTRLDLKESLYFIILFGLNFLLWIACVAIFSVYHFNINYTYYLHDKNNSIKSNPTWLEAPGFVMYMYSLLCTIVSCFIFSKIAYSVTHRCLKQIETFKNLEKKENETDDTLLGRLIEEDLQFTKMAQATIKNFEFWFTVHWIFYTVTSFLSIALFLDIIQYNIHSQTNATSGIGFQIPEIVVVGLFTVQHCFLFLYPCFKAAAVTVSREKLIKKINAHPVDGHPLNYERKNLYIQHLKNKKFGFRISFFCARLRFGFNVAYISIFIGLLGVLLKLTGVF